MDDQELQRLLSGMDAPEPDDNAAATALESALAAFDEKNAQTSQGKAGKRRLTHTNNPFAWLRRMMMQNKVMWSGLMGGVAVAALVGVLGMPYIKGQIDGMGVPREELTSSSSGFMDSAPQAPGTAKLKPVYEQAVREGSEQRAAEAEKVGGSALSTLIKRPSEKTAALARNDVIFDNNNDTNGAGQMAAAPMAKMVQESQTSYGATTSMPMPQMEMSEGVATSAIAPAPPYDMPSQGYRDEGRDKFAAFEENAVKDVAREPVSTFSIDVDTALYSFMRRQLNNGVLPPPDAIRIEEMVNYFTYDYALPDKAGHPFQPNIAVMPAPWNAQHKLVRIGIKGFDVDTKPQSNLVFLIDTSGSMDSPDKLPLLVNSFKLMLDSLQPTDTVGIVVYAGAAGTVLEPTKVAEKQKILTALNNLSAGGGTAGAEGIRQAYALAESAFIKGGNNRIVLATDGDFNVGISDPKELQDFVETKRNDGVSLSVLGFGQGNYNDAMMQVLAQNGNGNAAYIDTLNEARKVLVDEAASTLFTIAKDVKIQVEFNPHQVGEYRLIGYETRALAREDFNNDAVDAGEVGAGHAVTALYEITPVGAPKTVDDLRYGGQAPQPQAKADGGEIAFLKIRYKKPDGGASILMTRPITAADETSFDKASDDARFAVAVAGFGELLKHSKYAGSLTYDQVINIANGARGKDAFGQRGEFVNLVRLAKSVGGNQLPR